jgi:hypothetical protein
MMYRMEERTREEMAADDPFGGRGVFLPFPGMDMAAISGELADRGLGSVPSFIWDGIGAWAEVTHAGGS